MAANDEDYALQLHKQLNAIPLRTREGRICLHSLRLIVAAG